MPRVRSFVELKETAELTTKPILSLVIGSQKLAAHAAEGDTAQGVTAGCWRATAEMNLSPTPRGDCFL